jgi:LPS export ABC transporter protein LptC
VAIHVTRKQSLTIGLAILGSFFLISTLIIWSRSRSRIPTSSNLLTMESIRGEPTRAPAGQDTPRADSPFVLNEFHRSLVKDGKTEWEVFGKKGDYNPLTGRADVVEPRLNVTRPNKETITLTSKAAQLFITGTELTSATLTDDVTVTYKGETTLTTQNATYDREKHFVEIPTHVEVDNPMMRVEGERLTADLESQIIILSGGVRSTIKPSVKKPASE